MKCSKKWRGTKHQKRCCWGERCLWRDAGMVLSSGWANQCPWLQTSEGTGPQKTLLWQFFGCTPRDIEFQVWYLCAHLEPTPLLLLCRSLEFPKPEASSLISAPSVRMICLHTEGWQWPRSNVLPHSIMCDQRNWQAQFKTISLVPTQGTDLLTNYPEIIL